jgi:phosphoglycolate phosphatase-like HAD superfamily hydrolase
MTHVLFWDIDGTLLTTSRAGIFAWEEAVAEVIGRPADLQDLPTAGLTDTEIAAAALAWCKAEIAPDIANRVMTAYVRWLPERLGWRQGRVMPGVREILDTWRGRADVHHLLLTGNLRPCAFAKLRHYELDQYFEEGAFAEDAADRPGIARRALALARERLGSDLDPRHLYVIGDTPHDVHCGHAIGARTVALATGGVATDVLRDSGAWCALESLPAPPEFARLLALER